MPRQKLPVDLRVTMLRNMAQSAREKARRADIEPVEAQFNYEADALEQAASDTETLQLVKAFADDDPDLTEKWKSRLASWPDVHPGEYELIIRALRQAKAELRALLGET